MDKDFLSLLAMWALVHELADDAWKAAVERGLASDAEPMDSLAAMVAEQKDRLREALETGDLSGMTGEQASVDELRFELGEMRGRLEAMQASLDAITRKLDGRE